MEGVSKQFKGDQERLQEFVSQTQNFGKGLTTADVRQFFSLYLVVASLNGFS